MREINCCSGVRSRMRWRSIKTRSPPIQVTPRLTGNLPSPTTGRVEPRMQPRSAKKWKRSGSLTKGQPAMMKDLGRRTQAWAGADSEPLKLFPHRKSAMDRRRSPETGSVVPVGKPSVSITEDPRFLPAVPRYKLATQFFIELQNEYG